MGCQGSTGIETNMEYDNLPHYKFWLKFRGDAGIFAYYRTIPNKIRRTQVNYQYIRIKITDRVGWIEYNRPPINAFNWEMLREVPTALEAFLKDPQVRVIVFASAIEKYFSTGADL